MTTAERLAQAEATLAALNAAYIKAVGSMQYVQTGQRRVATHDIDKLRGDIAWWQKEVDRLDSLVNGTLRTAVNAPLRVNL